MAMGQPKRLPTYERTDNIHVRLPVACWRPHGHHDQPAAACLGLRRARVGQVIAARQPLRERRGAVAVPHPGREGGERPT